MTVDLCSPLLQGTESREELPLTQASFFMDDACQPRDVIVHRTVVVKRTFVDGQRLHALSASSGREVLIRQNAMLPCTTNIYSKSGLTAPLFFPDKTDPVQGGAKTKKW